MRGGRRHRCGGSSAEFLPERGQHLIAEEVKLLEYCTQRQPDVVDQEQLTLIITESFAEGQGFFDDLLRAADGQRSLRHEVLHSRAVAVDRRVVEIGPDLPEGILGVGPHEELTAHADNGFLRTAVAVVLEAFPVQFDQLLIVLFGPEDVVGEVAIAVVGGDLGDLRVRMDPC